MRNNDSKDILSEIVDHKLIEVGLFKSQLSEWDIHRRVESMSGAQLPSMAAALRQSASGIIAEFKRKSPSKGWINEQALPDVIPMAYQRGGAAALSILTDRAFFGGADEYISAARHAGVTLPILYKNFIVDEYQLFQARLCGASAVLLIAAVLPLPECKSLLRTAHELGMEVLLEMHDEHELDYAALEPDMCGINNRHLGTFVTDVETSFRLSAKLPSACVKVSESGISDPYTVCLLREAGYRGFLIGETFMRTPGPGQTLAQFVQALEDNTSAAAGGTLGGAHNPFT